DTQTSYALARDEQKRIRYLAIEPASESGDWSFTTTFFFDETGRTVLFERYHGASMESDCPHLVKETLTLFYDSDGRELAQTYELVDGDGTPVSDKNCAPEPVEHRLFKKLPEALAGEGLTAVVRKAPRRKNR